MGAYVALLRGINVGGRNPIAMADLRSALSARFDDVETYIQSGNVVFESGEPRQGLERTVEALIEQAFGIPVAVVLRSHRQLRAVVANAPEGFGATPETFHSDAMFLKAPLRADQVFGIIELREGVDQAWPGTGVVYFSRLSAQRSASRMSRIVGTPEYQRMTIRNWSTTVRLLDMLDRRAERSARDPCGS